MNRPNAGVWTEVSRSVINHLTGDGQFRERFYPMNFDIWIPFVILKAQLPNQVYQDATNLYILEEALS